MYTTLGLIDLQVNGFAGCDFNCSDIAVDKLNLALESMLKSGVTTFLPTIITATHDELIQRFIALDNVVNQSKLGKLMVPGYHIEGPFLNPADGYAGCHPTHSMVAPNADIIFELDKLLKKPILLVSYAPEQDIDNLFTQRITQAGKLLSVGHSNAGYSVLKNAVTHGLKMSTHLGNGVPQELHKLNNAIIAQLSLDELSASFIADGLHIPPFALKTLLRAKGVSRSILVTDAVSAAASPKSGMYPFANMWVERTDDGSVRVPGATNLAGSSLELDQAVRNLIKWELASFSEAIMMASTNPANLLADTLSRHGIQLPCSEVVWDEALNVIQTTIEDQVVRYYS